MADLDRRPEPIEERIGAALCDARIKAHMAQYELAKHLGISPSMMYLLETGQRRLKVSAVLQLPPEIRKRLLEELFDESY